MTSDISISRIRCYWISPLHWTSSRHSSASICSKYNWVRSIGSTQLPAKRSKSNAAVKRYTIFNLRHSLRNPKSLSNMFWIYKIKKTGRQKIEFGTTFDGPWGKWSFQGIFLLDDSQQKSKFSKLHHFSPPKKICFISTVWIRQTSAMHYGSESSQQDSWHWCEMIPGEVHWIE